MNFFTRLQRLQMLSLLALFVGGTILLFGGVNCLAGNPSTLRTSSWKARQFSVGSSFSVQSWLAVLGVGVSCTIYGLSRACTHLFNLECTQRALGPGGLDYGRYLNSLSHAPVLVGWRGFRVLYMVSYFFAALAPIATIGYKFTVFRVPLSVVESWPQSRVALSIPSSKGLDESGATPLLVDTPGGLHNQAFCHLGRDDVMDGPEQIVMVGMANCSGISSELDQGILVTREVVMVGTRVKPAGTFYMSADHAGWQRQRTVSDLKGSWVPSLFNFGAVVDYNIQGPGSIAMQWTTMFTGWDCAISSSACDNSTQYEVFDRVEYTFTYATAEVTRIVRKRSCATIMDEPGSIRLLSTRDINVPFETEYADGSLLLYLDGVHSVIDKRGSTPVEGISIFARAVMAGWANDAVNITGAPALGHARGQPFGVEKQSTITSSDTLSYPYFTGSRDSACTACYVAAAYVFIVTGPCMYLILITRIVAGPPRLTSWTGQHIALRGRLADEEMNLAAGYDAAPVNRLFVQLLPNKDDFVEELESDQQLQVLAFPPQQAQAHVEEI
ncbi:hypothetical protein AYO21_01115 [Fonsecaea monophora]|uniref:Uncharacterized protein n=1 Tax=Fonsecaea monophora TaxID=254056 RepID=A0A177FK93_9EURO|nr:hypothetical protein AYO21_01115 [Fonsecaea monophora]OAG44625.1 hypothetical protein AYO21_01115 [Fonsecaea monophora]